MTVLRQSLLFSCLLLLLSCCQTSSAPDYSFCQGAFWIPNPDDHSDLLYIYARNVENGMIIPPELWPKEELTQETFLTMLEKVLQHNFGLHQDEHTAQFQDYSSVAPFVWMDFFSFLRIKKFECHDSRWTDTEQSQVTRMALSKFYADVEGIQGLTNWVHPLKSYCTWKGILCDQDWKIQELRLTHMSLKGTLPSELGLIPSLPVIDLTGNKLSGSIPAALFSSIRYLDLSGNQFTGVSWESMHTDTFGSADPVIEYLDISANHLSGTFPARWNRQLANLRVLDASRNALTGTLSFPKDLSLLEMLFLGANLLTGTIPQLTGSLRLLDLGQNLLTGTIPSTILSTTSLEALILADNELEGENTLDLFVSLSKLEVLQLQNNHLKGSIPAASQWSELGTLSLRNNGFTGPIPPQFLQTVQQSLQL